MTVVGAIPLEGKIAWSFWGDSLETGTDPEISSCLLAVIVEDLFLKRAKKDSEAIFVGDASC